MVRHDYMMQLHEDMRHYGQENNLPIFTHELKPSLSKSPMVEYIGKGKFQRRDFRLDVLTGTSAFNAEGSLFAGLGNHEIFKPTKTYPPMTIKDLADQSGSSPEVAA